MASINTLNIVSKISKYCGFTKLCYFINRDKKRVIAYHNVIPDSIWDNSLHLDHSMNESNFRKQLNIIKDKFNIDLDIHNSKTVTITFDDGYLNQYEIASKIMDDLNISGYFFLVEDLINNKVPLAMDLIQFWISYINEGTYYIKEIDLKLNIKKDNRREEWRKVSDILLEGKVSLNDMKNYLDNIYPIKEIANKCIKKYKLRLEPIDKKAIESMKKNGHIIGAHSSKHKRLSTLNIDELNEDIENCSRMIGKLYNTKIFCYPYGSRADISDNVIKLLKKNDFDGAFAYSNSPILNYKYNNYFMPRMYLPNTGNKDLIDFILSGAKHMISFRKKLP